jgi:hypothetical protein
MYQVQDSSALVAGHRALLRPRAAGLRRREAGRVDEEERRTWAS